jgi:transposase
VTPAPEHAVDLDTGVIVAAPIHGADEGDTVTLDPTLAAAEKNLAAVGLTPTPEDPCDLVADKGYHSRDVLKDLDDSPWQTRIAEPRPSKGFLRWHGDDEARAAVYANRKRLRSGVGKEAMRKRDEVRACSRARRHAPHVAARPGKRPKTIPLHVAGHNLGILMRALFRTGTRREAAVIRTAFLFVSQTAEALLS